MGERKPQYGLRHTRLWLLIVLAGLLSGCSTIGFYYQSAKGQLDLVCRARDIDEVLKDDDVSSSVRSRLEDVKVMRRFASDTLHLPDNDSYRRYADLEREYAIWNVFAAPELSVEPHKWCFPIVGCVVYRGYFSEADAQSYASDLAAEKGLETFVAGVPAYSTLGWFDDPVLNTVIGYPEAELAGLIFHELAHQVAYAKGDSIFNESFATAVELEGVRRWLAHQGREAEIEAYRRHQQRNRAVVDMILAHRRRLDEIYRSERERDWKMAQKARVIADLKTRYAAMVRGWEGYRGYRRWFDEDLNNAHFAVVAAYHDLVPAFEALLDRHDGDLQAFYDAVVKLSRMPEDERREFLNGLPPRAAARPTDPEEDPS